MLQPGGKTFQIRVTHDSLNDFKHECELLGISMSVIMRYGATMALEYFKHNQGVDNGSSRLDSDAKGNV